MEQEGFLGHHRNRFAQAVFRDGRDINHINKYPTSGKIVVPQDELHECRLPRPASPHEPDFFSGRNGKREPLEYGNAAVIEPYFVKEHAALRDGKLYSIRTVGNVVRL